VGVAHLHHPQWLPQPPSLGGERCAATAGRSLVHPDTTSPARVVFGHRRGMSMLGSDVSLDGTVSSVWQPVKRSVPLQGLHTEGPGSQPAARVLRRASMRGALSHGRGLYQKIGHCPRSAICQAHSASPKTSGVPIHPRQSPWRLGADELRLEWHHTEALAVIVSPRKPSIPSRVPYPSSSSTRRRLADATAPHADNYRSNYCSIQVFTCSLFHVNSTCRQDLDGTTWLAAMYTQPEIRPQSGSLTSGPAGRVQVWRCTYVS